MRTGADIETSERMKYLQIIEDESMRLTELSQNILLLSKVEACQIVTDKERFDLSEQIKQVIILFLPQMDKKHIELDMELEDIYYYGNPELLEQVWINLLNNTVKFTPEEGEISIAAKHTNQAVMVQIADNGIGMDEETVSHIFEKYYQGKERGRGGNGIGLSIVERIISLCNGKVRVESIPNGGSTFFVTLPAKE